MLPNETEFKRSGNLGGEDVKMTFDEGSLGFLADVLINLYSDKELAVIREYSTNARDSHIAAGQTRPIEITTPSYLSYTFKIKDYGVGLSKQDIVNIYSKYGASTKRNTNEQVGMLGLGCKSALTYTDQFSIIAVKDGVKINVAVSRSEDGGGSMSIISETETTEPNGVEVVVPVNRENRFRTKTAEFFKFWGENEVLIDGQPPARPNLKKVTDRIFLKEDAGYYDKAYLIMGGVPYEINTDQITLPRGFVAYVDIGAVSFTPAREHLHYTQKTKNTLNALRDEYKDNIIESVQIEIDAQENVFGVANAFYQWRRTLQSQAITIVPSDFNYRGQDLNIEVDFDGHWQYGYSFDHRTDTYGGLRGVSITKVKSYTIVYGFEAEKLTSYQKQKLGYWAEQNGKPCTFYFCNKVPGDSWLDEVSQVAWSDILAIKLTRGATKSPTGKPTYEVYFDGKTDKVTELDKTKPIWYSTKAEWKDVTDVAYYLDRWFKDVQFAFVGQNRLNKFKTLYPKAIPLKDGMSEYIQGYVDNLTDEDKILISSDSYERSRFAELDKGRVVDPELQALIESSSKSDEIALLQRKWEDMIRLSWKACNYTIQDKISRNEKTKWVYERYPLFNNLVGSSRYGTDYKYWNHVYLYLNTAYKAWEVSTSNQGVE